MDAPASLGPETGRGVGAAGRTEGGLVCVDSRARAHGGGGGFRGPAPHLRIVPSTPGRPPASSPAGRGRAWRPRAETVRLPGDRRPERAAASPSTGPPTPC